MRSTMHDDGKTQWDLMALLQSTAKEYMEKNSYICTGCSMGCRIWKDHFREPVCESQGVDGFLDISADGFKFKR